jgi:hypothetical protein
MSDDDKRKSTVDDNADDALTPIADLSSGEPDDDVAAFAPDRPAVSDDLPRTMLIGALPKGLRRRLDRGDAVALTIAVPGPSWCDPIAIAATTLWGNSSVTSRNGSLRSEHKPSTGNDKVASALTEGRPVIGVSQAPLRYLPSSLTACSDAHLTIPPPGPAVIRRVLRSCARGPVPRQISAGIAAGLTFHDFVAAFRANASARDVLANLARASSAKTRVTATDSTPTLDKLPGYGGGEARQFALNLAAGIDRWRRAEVAWRDLSSAAVLAGPPGTGKTLFAKALARTCALPIVVTSTGEWFSTTDGTLGDVSRALQTAWDSAKAIAPAVFFVDELDALPNRETLSNRAREWWTPLVTLALTLFDGAVTSREGVVLIGATNFAGNLDPALVRSGRFDRIIEIPLPNASDLAAILRFHLGDAAPGADLLPIVRLATGASAADAAQWAREARAAAREAGRDLVVADIVAAVAPPDKRSPAELLRAAVHEAGHAVAQIALGGAIDSVSIVVAGKSGGRTKSGSRMAVFPTARDIDQEVTVTLAGRAAEAEFFDAPSAGAESDLIGATEMICSLHVSAGLGGSLLHLAPTGSASILLLHDAALRKTVEGHVERLYADALTLIRRHRAAVAAVSDTLVERRVLTGAEVAALVRGAAAGGGEP